MHMNPYLNFDGDCEAAFSFYAELLDGHIDAMETWGNSPMADQVPTEWQERIIHTQLSINGQVLMGSDSPPTYYRKPQGISITLNADTEEGERLFNALAENGTVTMPFEETFFAKRFGMVTDQYAIPWMIHCE